MNFFLFSPWIILKFLHFEVLTKTETPTFKSKPSDVDHTGRQACQAEEHFLFKQRMFLLMLPFKKQAQKLANQAFFDNGNLLT